MISVSTFEEFMMALSDTDDTIELLNDIDAEDYGILNDNFKINKSIEGNGHKIFNMLIESAKGLAFDGTITIKDVYFKDITIYNATNEELHGISHLSSTATKFSNCKFSIRYNAGGSHITLFAMSLGRIDMTDCAFDIQIVNNTTISFVTNHITLKKCNIIIRDAYISKRGSKDFLDVADSSWIRDAIVLDNCIINKSNLYGFRNNMSNGYLALHDCTSMGSTELVIIGNESSLFCNDSEITTSVSTADNPAPKEVTPAQLKSETYLWSIGFI